MSEEKARSVVVITGGHTGIGFELCKKILSNATPEGTTLVLLYRLKSVNAGGAAELTEFAADKNCSVESYECDVSSIASIKAAAAQVLQAHPIINYLFNNAGYLTREEEVTVDGLEREWAINTIAPYVLSEQLRPALAKGGVIVNTSSGAVYAPQTMKTLLDTDYKTPGLLGMYAMSKRVLTTMTLHMKTSFAQDDIYICSVDPGGNTTNMTQGPGLHACMRCFFMVCLANKPTFGATLLFNAAFVNRTVSPELFESGCFIGDGGKCDTKKLAKEYSDTDMQRLIMERIVRDSNK